MKKPKMSNEELIKLARQGDTEAFNQLMEYNSRLSYHIAHKFHDSGVEVEDLASFAHIGLLKAYNTFDLDREIKFATYASRIMTNEILMSFRKSNRHQGLVYLDEEVYDGEGGQTPMSSFVPDDVDVEQEIEQNDTISLIKRGISLLKDPFHSVAKLHLIDEKTQHEISDSLNISQSYVSRLILKATKAVREYVETGSMNKKFFDMEEKDMAKTINLGHLRYIVETYPNFRVSDVVNFFGVSAPTLRSRVEDIKNGKYPDVVADPSIEARIVGFIEKWTKPKADKPKVDKPKQVTTQKDKVTVPVDTKAETAAPVVKEPRIEIAPETVQEAVQDVTSLNMYMSGVPTCVVDVTLQEVLRQLKSGGTYSLEIRLVQTA